MIFSKCLSDNASHVCRVFQHLLGNPHLVKMEKKEFYQGLVCFFMYVFSACAIQMDQHKIKAVADWPTSSWEFQRFLGFFLSFFQNYSTLAAPLMSLTSSAVSFSWSSALKAAFLDLKSCFKPAPILIQPDPDIHIIVEEGASIICIRATLAPLLDTSPS